VADTGKSQRVAFANLDFLDAASAELNPQDASSLKSWLIGYVAHAVPPATWAEGVAAGIKMLEESR